MMICIKSSDMILRKLSFMKRYVDYLKSLNLKTLDLEYDYELGDFEEFAGYVLEYTREERN